MERKENILGVLILIMSAISLVIYGAWACVTQMYFLDTTVVEIEQTPFGTNAIAEDEYGNLWAFNKGNAEVGDSYVLVMDNLRNDNLYDDIIEFAIRKP